MRGEVADIFGVIESGAIALRRTGAYAWSVDCDDSDAEGLAGLIEEGAGEAAIAESVEVEDYWAGGCAVGCEAKGTVVRECECLVARLVGVGLEDGGEVCGFRGLRRDCLRL